MSDDVRYYFNVDDVQHNLYNRYGVVKDYGYSHNRSSSYSDMKRHRPKPKVLLPTGASFSYIGYSYVPGTFVTGDMSVSGIGYSGSWKWTHSSSTISKRNSWDSRTFSSDADLSAAGKLTERFGTFGEDLATLNQTGNMIGKRARQIGQMGYNLAHGNWLGLEKQVGSLPKKLHHIPASKRLANGWLELQFGWLPLLEDAFNAIDAYRYSAENGQQIEAYGMAGDRRLRSDRTDSMARNDRFSSYSGNASVKYYGTVSNSSLLTLNQLGLANPLKLAWDLLPYSFVIDWFLPVGQILAYLSKGLGLTDLTKCMVTEHGTADTWRNGGGTYVSRSVTRTVSTATPLPDLTRLSPRSFGIWKAVTGIALMRQRFRG